MLSEKNPGQRLNPSGRSRIETQKQRVGLPCHVGVAMLYYQYIKNS